MARHDKDDEKSIDDQIAEAEAALAEKQKRDKLAALKAAVAEPVDAEVIPNDAPGTALDVSPGAIEADDVAVGEIVPDPPEAGAQSEYGAPMANVAGMTDDEIDGNVKRGTMDDPRTVQV